MIVLLGCACLSSSLAVGGYLMYQNSNTASAPAPAPQTVGTGTLVPAEDPAPAPDPAAKADLVTAPKPKPLSARDAVLAQGQKIQVAEFNLNEAIGAAGPTGIDTKKVAYTMSMDIKLLVPPNQIEMEAHVFSNDETPKSTVSGTTQRRPSLILLGDQLRNERDKIGRLYVGHSTGNNTYDRVKTRFKATQGQYFNITWTVADGLLSVYIDGKLDGTLKGAFTWSTKANKWSWNPENQNAPVSIKNVYWFNKALSASEVALIGKKQTSGVSAYTLRYELGNPF
jgi:hypothetical protein